MKVEQNTKKKIVFFFYWREASYLHPPRVGADPCVCPNNKGIASRDLEPLDKGRLSLGDVGDAFFNL